MERIVPLRKASPNPFMQMISRHHCIEGVAGVQAAAFEEIGLVHRAASAESHSGSEYQSWALEPSVVGRWAFW